MAGLRMTLKPIRLVFLLLMVLLSILIAAYAFSYFRFAETDFLSNKQPDIRSSILWQIPFYLHVGFGGVALLTGGFQFFASFRDRFIIWHRRNGIVYVSSVFISSVGGFVLAIFAEGGAIAKVGFAVLAILWFTTDLRGYREIRRGNIESHRAWMVRNYALTFAAVTLRIILPFELAVIGMSFVDAYRIVAWLCWVPNLLVAELLVYGLAAPLRSAAART